MEQINKMSKLKKGNILLIQETDIDEMVSSMIMKLVSVKKFSDHLKLFGSRYGIHPMIYVTYYFYFDGEFGDVFKLTVKEAEIELV
jgi:hypothetical protein